MIIVLRKKIETMTSMIRKFEFQISASIMKNKIIKTNWR